MHVEPEPAALRQLPAGYRELFGQLLEAAIADARIRAMWLSGSLGRGVADHGSDLDVVLAVTDADLSLPATRRGARPPRRAAARGEWLLGVVGVQQMHLLLYQLFVESDQPLPPMGIKQWSAKLTPAQRYCSRGLQASELGW